MTLTTSSLDHQACFQLKANFVPCTILQLIKYDLDAFAKHLTDTISRAPNFFLGSPIVIDLEKVKALGSLNFSELKQIILSKGLIPVGVRNGSEEQNVLAAAHGLPALTVGKLMQAESPKKKISESFSTTKIVTTPIRSGMQVYAKESDLIVTAAVSHGAELLADGNIHAYGSLRGRVLAGVQGNTNVRIFCRNLEAELISIAGYYLTKDDMQALPESHGMIQVYLENEQLRIEAI